MCIAYVSGEWIQLDFDQFIFGFSLQFRFQLDYYRQGDQSTSSKQSGVISEVISSDFCYENRGALSETPDWQMMNSRYKKRETNGIDATEVQAPHSYIEVFQPALTSTTLSSRPSE